METSKRLYRSRTDSVIAGVSGGLAKYFAIDPIIVRVLFVVLTLFASFGVLAYIILWIVMPYEPYEAYYSRSSYSRPAPPDPAATGTTGSEFTSNETTNSEFDNTILNPEEEMRKKHTERNERNEGSLIGGIILITLGGLFLAGQFIPRIDFGDLWPVLLIVVGILIIFGRSRNGRQ